MSNKKKNDDTVDLEISPEKKKAKMDLKSPPRKKEKEMIDLILSKNKKNDKMNKKEAVLIGLNHPDSDAIDIKGQILRMKNHLMKFRGFPEDNITLFIDDEDEALYVKPTEINIRLKLCSLVDSAQRGDILFIHLIAYGCSDGVILTTDKQHIPDGFFRAILMIAVRQGYHLTFVSDCLIEPAAKCTCSAQIPLNVKSQEEKDKEITEFWENFVDNPDALDTFATVDFPNLNQTKLSYVDILNPKEKKTKDDGSSRVILLMPYRLDQNSTTTTQEEDDSLDDHSSDEDDDSSHQNATIEEEDSIDDHSSDNDFSDQHATTQEEDSLDDHSSDGDSSDQNATTVDDESLYIDFIDFPFPRKKASSFVQNATTQKEYSIDVSELFFPPPKGTTSPQHTLYGSFTNTILDVIEETHGQVTNLELAQKAMKKLGEIPSLRCSHHNHTRASFVC